MCVCVSALAAFPHYCTDPDVIWGLVGSAPSCALLGRWSRVRFPAAVAITGMGDRLRAGKPANYVSISPSHAGQLSLLSSAERKMSTSQNAVTLCGWGVKAGMAHSTCG